MHLLPILGTEAVACNWLLLLTITFVLTIISALIIFLFFSTVLYFPLTKIEINLDEFLKNNFLSEDLGVLVQNSFCKISDCIFGEITLKLSKFNKQIYLWLFSFFGYKFVHFIDALWSFQYLQFLFLRIVCWIFQYLPVKSFC